VVGEGGIGIAAEAGAAGAEEAMCAGLVITKGVRRDGLGGSLGWFEELIDAI